ncbi:MAG: flagellar biosynthesis anti-sigma factor FlgM [Armatimonadetes bacterium]|nr:flagellar biosynthesis anti-sigma factor FlgM [Armatimonadota bacterium]
MIIPTGGADKTLGVHLQKIHKTDSTTQVERASRRDVVSISKFSALIELGRSSAMALPDVRSDVVDKARQSMQDGTVPESRDIASAMINRAAEGLV